MKALETCDLAASEAVMNGDDCVKAGDSGMQAWAQNNQVDLGKFTNKMFECQAATRPSGNQSLFYCHIVFSTYFLIQEEMFFEGISKHEACIKIKLSRREWVSFLLSIIFDDFGMTLKPDDRWLFTSFANWGCFQQILYISTT